MGKTLCFGDIAWEASLMALPVVSWSICFLFSFWDFGWGTFQGEGYIQENAHNLGGAEQNYHKMMGTAVLAYNNLGIYTDKSLAPEAE